jgi:hypothetical protein
MLYSRSDEQRASYALRCSVIKVGRLRTRELDIGLVSKVLLSSTTFNDEAAGARGAQDRTSAMSA